MKWLITGGTGQLAIALSRILNENEINFSLLSKDQLDISRNESIPMIIKHAPDVIVNCAAWTKVDSAESDAEGAFQANEQGARNIAIAARELSARLVHVSTDYVFSGDSNTPWRTDSPCEPRTRYGESKLAGELAVKQIYPGQNYIIRTAWLYSPWGKNFAKTMLKLALNEKDVRVVSDQVGQPTSALDLARQILLLIKEELPYGCYHGTNSGEATWFDFAKEIFALANVSEARVLPISTLDYPTQAERPKYSVLDLSEWLKTTISPMQDWREALIDTFPLIRGEVEREISRG
jgi:dTDP-4-dehydrorhamnose reductase